MCYDTSNDKTSTSRLYIKNHIVKDLDAKFIEITGYTKEELLGKSINDLFELLKLNILKKKERNTCFFITKNNTCIEIDFYKKDYFYDKSMEFIFIIDSIVKLEDKFPYAYSLYMENKMGVAIYYAKDLRLLKANETLLNFLQEPHNKIENSIGRTLPEILPNWPGSESEKIWKDVITSKKTYYGREKIYEGFNRGITYWDVVITPIIEDGTSVYIIQTITDSTEHVLDRKKIEEQNKTLEQIMEKKSNFFSMISHELKTPLNVILGALQLMENLDTNDLNSSYKLTQKYIKMQKQNSFRLLKLINNLIDITKIEENHFTINNSNFDIVRVIENITMSAVKYTKLKNIDLIFDTEVEEKYMAFDIEKIERIMLNLLSNAIKFTDPGGKIEVAIYDRKEKILISVKDSGIGIPEDMLDKIFDHFTQVDTTLRRKAEGSGIGLFLVKSLVEIQGGTISVKSQYGKGSEFLIELPVKLIDNEVPIEDNRPLSNISKINIEFSDIYF